MTPRRCRNWVDVSHIAQATVAKFTTTSIVDEEKVLVIGRELLGLVEQAGRRAVILNFENVERISAALLGDMMALHRRARARGGRLVLCGLNSPLAEAFKLINGDGSLTICDHQHEALMAL